MCIRTYDAKSKDTLQVDYLIIGGRYFTLSEAVRASIGDVLPCVILRLVLKRL